MKFSIDQCNVMTLPTTKKTNLLLAIETESALLEEADQLAIRDKCTEFSNRKFWINARPLLLFFLESGCYATWFGEP